MKQVWILCHYAKEPQDSGGARHYSLAKYLLENDWEATIIASSMAKRSVQCHFGKNWNRRVDDISGIRFVRIMSPAYEGNGVGRILNWVIYSIRVLIPGYTAELPHPDAIIGSSVHPLAAVSAAILARRFRVPFIFEVRDLWPQTLIDMGRLKPRGIITMMLKRLEKKLYQVAKRIIVLLPRAADYISPLGIPENKIVWISNGADIDSFKTTEIVKPSAVFILMYLGAHGNANCLETLLQAMHILKKRDLRMPIQLRMIGDGTLKSELIEMARLLELDNISFEDAVPRELIPTIAAEADSFVITVKDLPGLYKYGISMNKIFDYMAAGRPTVIAVNAANNPISEANAGFTVAPEEPVALANGIEDLINLTDEERRAMGLRGRQHVEKTVVGFF